MKVYLAWIGEHEPQLHGVFADRETAMRSATIERNRDFDEMLNIAGEMAAWLIERGPDPVGIRECDVIQ